MKRWIVLCALVLSACSGKDADPTPIQTTANVAGVWDYFATVSNVSGGSCLTDLYRSRIGANLFGSLSISQIGASLTATSRDSSTGVGCQWSGTADRSSMSLGWTYCDAAHYTSVRCLSGALVDMHLVTSVITANVSGRNATGTEAETWNVALAGSPTNFSTLTFNSTFSAAH